MSPAISVWISIIIFPFHFFFFFLPFLSCFPSFKRTSSVPNNWNLIFSSISMKSLPKLSFSNLKVFYGLPDFTLNVPLILCKLHLYHQLYYVFMHKYILIHTNVLSGYLPFEYHAGLLMSFLTLYVEEACRCGTDLEV